MTQTGTDKSSTFLKHGVIYHQAGRGVWIAERLSKSEISFAPKENVHNSFVWKMDSPDVWTAEINSAGRDGQPKRTIYRLERIKSNRQANVLEAAASVTGSRRCPNKKPFM